MLMLGTPVSPAAKVNLMFIVLAFAAAPVTFGSAAVPVERTLGAGVPGSGATFRRPWPHVSWSAAVVLAGSVRARCRG